MSEVVKYDIEGNEIVLTKEKVIQFLLSGGAKNISIGEYKMFSELCKVKKLNPFLREAYIIKYSEDSPATIVVAKDVFFTRASLHKKFKGIESGIIVMDGGKIKELQGSVLYPKQALLGGWAKVYREDRDIPYYVSVSFNEYINQRSPIWRSKPATMIKKVASVQALRDCFPELFSGMYEEEEIETKIESSEVKIEDNPILKEIKNISEPKDEVIEVKEDDDRVTEADIEVAEEKADYTMEDLRAFYDEASDKEKERFLEITQGVDFDALDGKEIAEILERLKSA